MIRTRLFRWKLRSNRPNYTTLKVTTECKQLPEIEVTVSPTGRTAQVHIGDRRVWP